MYTFITNKLNQAKAQLKEETQKKVDHFFKYLPHTNSFCAMWSLAWGSPYLACLPQYRFIAGPVYRLLGGRDNYFISVPASFVTTSTLMHHVLPKVIYAAIKKQSLSSINIDLAPAVLAAYFAMSIPVVIHKYQVNRAKEKLAQQPNTPLPRTHSILYPEFRSSGIAPTKTPALLTNLQRQPSFNL